MKRLLACSDIHGQFDQFIELLNKASFNRDFDKLVLLGDYVDRGPDTRKVIHKVMDLVENHNAIALIGNHDLWFIENVIRPNPDAFDTWFYQGGMETIESYIGHEIMCEHAEWMDTHLKYYYELGDFIFVHAGVFPSLPMEEQNKNQLIWIRHSAPCNLGKLVVHGHTPVKEITKIHDQLFIDTGSVYGGKLSMIDLLSGEIFEV